MTKIYCACGRRSGEVVCGKGGEMSEVTTQILARSVPQILTRVAFLELTAHSSLQEETQALELRSLPCDDLCEIEKRNKKLAEAFGRAVVPTETTKWPSDLVDLAQTCPAFIQQVLDIYISLFLRFLRITR
jgi:hypothetical protein